MKPLGIGLATIVIDYILSVAFAGLGTSSAYTLVFVVFINYLYS